MYSAQHMDVPSKATLERLYSMNSSLNEKDNMSTPKKDNVFQSMFNALNVIWEHFSRVPGSFLANVNNPLSVTVVNNEGIISHDFFKSLTTRKEQLTTDNMYIHNVQAKEPLNIVENIHCSIFDERKSYVFGAFNDDMNSSFKSSYKYVDTKEIEIVEKSDKGETFVKENSDDCLECNKSKANNTMGHNSSTINNSENKGKSELLEHLCSDAVIRKMHTKEDFDNFDSGKQTILNCKDLDTSTKPHTDTETCQSTQSNVPIDLNSSKQTVVPNLLTNMWHKVVDGLTDRLYQRTESVDPEMTTTRSFSPKQRRKINTVAKGRGRGRGRSQLRRSGVSQTRHRKERIKHDLETDIQDDFESWQEFDMYHTVQCIESIDCFNLNDGVDVTDAVEHNLQETINPMTYTIADVKPRSQKPKTRKMIHQEMSKFPTRVRYVPDCTVELNNFHQDNEGKYNQQKTGFRPRLMSESSADSEDSYCIVFETGSETNYKSDTDGDEESDEDESSEEEIASSMQKVKFNLKPIVHIMVRWDYAYRAARRGPWEEMARDRERFKGRINCIARVLNPILSVQHRNHIWQERFAPVE